MDIFAHGLWGAAAAKVLNRSVRAFQERPISPWWTGFWATFPDLLAFGPLVGLIIISVLAGSGDLLGFHGVIGFLYALGHSLVTWGAVVLTLWVVTRRLPWELMGWLTHILIDIGTHPEGYYTTRFIWPVSDFSIGGTSWRTPLFILVNYGLLMLAHYVLRDHKDIGDGFRATSKTRKVILVLLFISLVGALGR